MSKNLTVAILLILTSAVYVLGQTAGGTISGRVTYSTGAVLIGAPVDLTNIERGTVSNTATNQAGIYLFPSVQPGQYRITVRSPGFKQTGVQKLIVDVGARLEQNFQLQLGPVTESATVQSTDLLNTVTSTVSSVVTGTPIQNLPLNGRHTLSLALTQPGVMPAAIDTAATSVINNTNQIVIGGGRSNSVTYLLDGGNNTSVAYATPVVDPNPDSVGEFRILTSNYSAEYGRSAGGVVSVVTKSGTNAIHGTAYDYLRNTDFNANDFFNKAGGPQGYQPRPALNRNQFGVTTGGPLILPKIVNGKDRFFFFFGYQGQRQSAVQVEPQVRVYTPAELSGDFSHAVSGSPDPNVVNFLLSHLYFQPNSQLASQGIIDPSRINPAAQAYAKNNLVPTSPTGILTPNASATDNRDEFIGKLDLHFTPADVLSLTLVHFHNPQLLPFLGNQPNVPAFPSADRFDNAFGTLGYTKIFSPTILNEFHFTAQNEFNRLAYPALNLPGPQALGIKINPDNTTGPTQILLNASGPQLGFNPNGPAHYSDTTYVYADTVSWNKGRHVFKFGGQLGFAQNNSYFAYANVGVFTFNGPTGIGSGTDLADFLFGIPDSFSQFPQAWSASRSRQWAAFALSEWQLRPNFTLNLGIRYEYSTPMRDVKPRPYYLIPDHQSVKFPLAPEGILFPGDPGAPPNNEYSFPDRTNWAPRIGFAWDPTRKGKTSLRGGLGVFYDTILAQAEVSENGTSPVVNSSFIAFSPSLIPANGPVNFLSDPYGSTGTVNGFPSKSLSPSTNFATAGLLPLGPASVFVNPFVRTPYTYQWNLTLQQAIGSGVALEIGYLGSVSRKIYNSHANGEDVDPFILGTTTRVLNTQPGLQYPNAYAQAPYTWGNYDGNANYNAMLVSVTKRLANWHSLGQIFFTLSYTLAHSLNDADLTRNDYYNNSQFYGPASTDIRHRLVFSGGWKLPFDKLWPDGPNQLTTGWSLYPIVTTQSGFPIDVSVGLFQDGVTPGPSGDGDQPLVRPNWVGGPVQYTNPGQVQTFRVNGNLLTGHFFFNPSGFVVPACFSSPAPPGTPGGCPAVTYGDTQRNTFRGPSLTNFDLALEKSTNLVADRVQMVFRAEFFNVLNHTEWQPQPAYTLSSEFVGQITSTYPARIGQLALKLVF
jgi:hypothetical protein